MEKILKKATLSVIFLVFVSGCTGISGGAFLQSEEGCFPKWDCTDWDPCSLKEGKWIQTRVCRDVNTCGIEENKPSETQKCEPPLEYEVKLEEVFSQCDINIKIDSVTISKNIFYTDRRGIQNWLNLTSDEIFVVPKIEITNNFRNNIQTSFLHFKLEDQDGVTYKSRCPNNDVEDCQEGNGWHFGSKYIEPTESNEGHLIFFVPENTSEIKLLYEMPYISYDCDRIKTLYWKIK